MSERKFDKETELKLLKLRLLKNAGAENFEYFADYGDPLDMHFHYSHYVRDYDGEDYLGFEEWIDASGFPRDVN